MPYLLLRINRVAPCPSLQVWTRFEWLGRVSRTVQTPNSKPGSGTKKIMSCPTSQNTV